MQNNQCWLDEGTFLSWINFNFPQFSDSDCISSLTSQITTLSFLIPSQAALHFPKYYEPIEKGEATYSDSHKLWRNIGPHLKRALNTVYLREVSSKQWENMLALEHDVDPVTGITAVTSSKYQYL